MPTTPESELEQLGENIPAELASLINACVDAAKKVEADGTSYQHMPDWFKACGSLLAWHQKEVAEARIQAVKESLDWVNQNPAVFKKYLNRKELAKVLADWSAHPTKEPKS